MCVKSFGRITITGNAVDVSNHEDLTDPTMELGSCSWSRVANVLPDKIDCRTHHDLLRWEKAEFAKKAAHVPRQRDFPRPFRTNG